MSSIIGTVHCHFKGYAGVHAGVCVACASVCVTDLVLLIYVLFRSFLCIQNGLSRFYMQIIMYDNVQYV